MADIASADAPAPAKGRMPWLRRARPARLGFVGSLAFVICGIYVLAAIFGPIFLSHSANQVGQAAPFMRPNGRFPFGTDDLGRNELSRIIVAARIAIVAAVESIAIAAVVGTIIGVVAGYVGSFVDEALSRLMDLLFSIPSYLLGIVVIVVLGTGLQHASLAIATVFVPQFARIARSATIEIKDRAYIQSARLAGRGQLWILTRHVIPNILTPLSVMVGVSLANAEGTYAVLSYLGFGSTPPTADYGTMLSDAQQYITSDPWLIFFPSAALVVLILGFVLLGDWMRDRFDTSTRVAMVGASE